MSHRNKIFIITLFLLIATSVYSQEDKNNLIDIDYYSPKEYEVGDITIRGAENLDKTSVILLSGISVGQKITVPSDKFSDAIDKLWKQGIFDEIQINITKVEGRTISLEYYLETKPRLAFFKIEGITRSEADKIKEKMKISMGDVVTDNLKNNCTNAIHDYFADKGYYLTKTNIEENKDTTSKRKEVSLIFKIDKGKKVRISHINVEGNKQFTDKKIRRQMKNTKEYRWWRVWKSSRLVESDFKADKDLIIEKYNNEGYRDARITFDTSYLTTTTKHKFFPFWKKKTKENVVINMNVYEGKKFYFRNITWIGNTKYTSEELSHRLRINKGDAYNKDLLQKNVNYDPTGKDISSLYLDDGYLFFHAIPTEINVDNDSIDIEMRIYEGNQARIGRVAITGNTATSDYVVMRELKTMPGQLFSRDDVLRSVREIQQLGYFNAEKIEPKVEPNQDNGTVDITYKLEETSSSQLNLSGGWGGGMVIGTLGVSLNNFSARKVFDRKAWTPLPIGDGQKISVQFQTNGTYYYSGGVSFTEPWLGGRKPNSLTFGVYYSYQDDSYYNTSSTADYYLSIFSASVSLGKRLNWPDDYFSLSQGIKYQLYNVKNYTTFIMATGKSNSLAYTLNVGRNSVDQYIYPRTGSDVSMESEFTFPYSLVNGKDYTNMTAKEQYKWLEYYKINLRAAWYFNIVDDFVLSTRSRFGFLGRYNKDLDYSPFGRYYVGGDGLTGYALDGREIVALRGYESGDLSASSGATVFDKFTMELRYPITLNPTASVFALAFVEGGNSWSNFDSFSPFKMYRSAGVGIRIFMQMFGMLGLDWGYGFDPISGKTTASGSQFHISINQSID
jgi:outer membrane protein insertion porin family